jgi:hypothetical protein
MQKNSARLGELIKILNQIYYAFMTEFKNINVIKLKRYISENHYARLNYCSIEQKEVFDIFHPDEYLDLTEVLVSIRKKLTLKK